MQTASGSSTPIHTFRLGLGVIQACVLTGASWVHAQSAPSVDGRDGAPFGHATDREARALAVLHNAAQQFETRFDGRGFTIAPVDAAWSWGLALRSIGRGDRGCTLEGAGLRVVGEGRVEYAWTTSLSEWWSDGPAGLEHGLTIRERHDPVTGGPLELEFDVRGGLRGALDSDGRGASFRIDDGRRVLDYSGLRVFDAEGRELDARLDLLEASTLRFVIDDRSAVYPLTVDPVAQQAYVKASNTGPLDNFGWSVALSGDTLVVGAPAEASATMGVNGNQADDSASYAGAAYVFVQSGGTWTQQAYLKASNTNAGDFFGNAVAVSGDLIVIGAPLEASSAVGVGGNEADNSTSGAGAAYVFARSGSVWTQVAYLKASNTDPDDRFGTSVAISGTTILVGAPLEDSGATGVNGNHLNNAGPDSGAVYVFEFVAGAWSQQAYLKASNNLQGFQFGQAVALDQDLAVVGAPHEPSSSTGVDGNQNDQNSPLAGAAYAFVRAGSQWTQQAYIKASNTSWYDEFGGAVAVSGETIAIGAQYEDSAATGVNGNQNDESAGNAGAAYVLRRTAGAWAHEAYVKASNAETSDHFGRAVSIFGDTLFVGAEQESGADHGINGNQSGNGIPMSGAAYLLRRHVTLWSQIAYVKASHPDFNDRFGWSVAAGATHVVAGAPYEGSNAVGLNGDQLNNLGFDSGAVYLFTADPTPASFCLGDGSGAACPCGNTGSAGHGCASSGFAGGAILSSSGYPGASGATDSLVLTATDIPGPGLFFQSSNTTPVPISFGDGHLCASVGIIRLGVVFPTAGVASYPGGITPNAIHVAGAPIAPGDTRHYQCWYRSVPGLCSANNYSTTQGLSVLWWP